MVAANVGEKLIDFSGTKDMEDTLTETAWLNEKLISTLYKYLFFNAGDSPA